MSTRRKRRPGPPGGKRDRNRQQRSAAITAAALELFLERGIETVTIDEIVERAEIAKGSFYRYFDDKARLVEAIFGPVRDEVAGALDACEKAISAADSKKTLTDAYALLAMRLGEAIVKHAKEAQLYLQEARSPAHGARGAARQLADQIRRRALDLTDVAHARGLLRPFDARVSAIAVVGAAESLLFALLSGVELGNPLEIPGLLVSMVIDGLKVR